MRLKNILAVAAFLCLSILLMFVCGGQESAHKERTPIEKASMQPVVESSVYISTQDLERRYHSKRGCIELTEHNGYIKTITIQQATQQGRTPCKMCH